MLIVDPVNFFHVWWKRKLRYIEKTTLHWENYIKKNVFSILFLNIFFQLWAVLSFSFDDSFLIFFFFCRTDKVFFFFFFLRNDYSRNYTRENMTLPSPPSQKWLARKLVYSTLYSTLCPQKQWQKKVHTSFQFTHVAVHIP